MDKQQLHQRGRPQKYPRAGDLYQSLEPKDPYPLSSPPMKELPKEQPETAPQPLSPQVPEQPSQEPKSLKTEELPKSDACDCEEWPCEHHPRSEPIQIDVSTMVVLLQAEVARLKRAVELLYWTRPANVTTPKSQEMVSELDKMYKFQTK